MRQSSSLHLYILLGVPRLQGLTTVLPGSFLSIYVARHLEDKEPTCKSIGLSTQTHCVLGPYLLLPPWTWGQGQLTQICCYSCCLLYWK